MTPLDILAGSKFRNNKSGAELLDNSERGDHLGFGRLKQISHDRCRPYATCCKGVVEGLQFLWVMCAVKNNGFISIMIDFPTPGWSLSGRFKLLGRCNGR